MVQLRALGKRDQKKYQDATVRRCSPDCFFFKNGGNGCQFYQKKECFHGDVCMYDLVKIKAYADAFHTGDTETIKNDASKITAGVMMLIENMLQQVAVEGSTLEEPFMDAKGAVVYLPDPNWVPGSGEARTMVPAMRIREHPLISRAIQLAKSIGVNLSEFKLTPKSADEKPQVAGHIIVENQIDMEVVIEKRLKIEERFLAAVKVGNELTKQDPIFQQLLDQGEIING